MSLFGTLSVSASGMDAQRARAEVLAENLANSETTRTAGGGPYRRKDVVFASTAVASPFGSEFQSALDGQGVKVASISVDQRDPEKRYMPGHPDADKDGYVAFPRINPAEDMVDLMNASRGYQANVAAISAVKDMIQRSLDFSSKRNSQMPTISPFQVDPKHSASGADRAGHGRRRGIATRSARFFSSPSRMSRIYRATRTLPSTSSSPERRTIRTP